MRIFGVVSWLLLLATCLYGSQGCAEINTPTKARPSEAVKDFAQTFYRWYVPEALKAQETPAWSVALKYKRNVFGGVLLGALKEDFDAQEHASGEIVGLDFDPFLNTQDPCDRYEVGSVTPHGNEYSVDIYGVCSGKRDKKPDVIAEATHKNGSWVFTNFLYPAIHSDLLGTLRILQDERKRSGRSSK